MCRPLGIAHMLESDSAVGAGDHVRCRVYLRHANDKRPGNAQPINLRAMYHHAMSQNWTPASRPAPTEFS